jgi:Dynamin central region
VGDAERCPPPPCAVPPGVVNRSQHDINTRRSVADARAAEAAFFASRPEYASVASQCGTVRRGFAAFGIQFVLFGMQNRTFCPYLASMPRIVVPPMRRPRPVLAMRGLPLGVVDGYLVPLNIVV